MKTERAKPGDGEVPAPDQWTLDTAADLVLDPEAPPFTFDDWVAILLPMERAPSGKRQKWVSDLCSGQVGKAERGDYLAWQRANSDHHG